ncbi:MAG: hypothetical protein E7052_03185 [Lentisphaerae bacterium]|nr:hypothetical protein [Lentisphaerota bacterium]
MKKLHKLSLVASAMLLGICSAYADTPENVKIKYTSSELKIDGKLDESAWQSAVCYPLQRHNNWAGLPEKTRKRVQLDPFQPGSFRLLYNDKYLYLGIDFEDSDVIAGSTKNQSRLYRTGDLAELFLTPGNGHAYFEIYVNPVGAHTFYVFPGGGVANLEMMFDENKITAGIIAAAQVQGTLNNHSDRDRGWSAELAVPLEKLAIFGIEFAFGKPWTILVSRYNYAVHLRKLQFSGVPIMPAGSSYGDLEYHAPLLIQKK